MSCRHPGFQILLPPLHYILTSIIRIHLYALSFRYLQVVQCTYYTVYPNKVYKTEEANKTITQLCNPPDASSLHHLLLDVDVISSHSSGSVSLANQLCSTMPDGILRPLSETYSIHL